MALLAQALIATAFSSEHHQVGATSQSSEYPWRRARCKKFSRSSGLALAIPPSSKYPLLGAVCPSLVPWWDAWAVGTKRFSSVLAPGGATRVAIGAGAPLHSSDPTKGSLGRSWVPGGFDSSPQRVLRRSGGQPLKAVRTLLPKIRKLLATSTPFSCERNLHAQVVSVPIARARAQVIPATFRRLSAVSLVSYDLSTRPRQ